MKKYVLLILLGILPAFSFAQNAFYDAIALRNFIDSSSKKFKNDKPSYSKYLPILAKYLPGPLRSDTVQTSVVNGYFMKAGNNPFLGPLMANIVTPATSKTATSLLNSVGSTIGGLDVTNIANATADLMIERAKQELTIAFFNKFQTFANNHPEFKILLPVTTNNLKNLLTYNYPKMLPVLQAGFIEDLDSITYHLDGVLNTPDYKKLFDQFPEVSIAIRSLSLIHGLETKKYNAADVIDSFAALHEWDDSGTYNFKNISASVRMGAIISQSLRSKDSTRIWISSSDIKSMFGDSITTQIFLGLIYQEVKNKELKIYTSGNAAYALDSIIKNEAGTISMIKDQISDFISIADDVTDDYKAIKYKKVNYQKISNDDLYNYINTSINVVSFSFDLIKIFDKKGHPTDISNYLTIIQHSNSLYKYLYKKQYTVAINSAINILMDIDSLTQKDLNNFKLDKSNQKKLDSLCSFIKKVQPYFIFVANVADAQSSDDVKAALENAVLPVGSSSIKKNTKNNLCIQSYIGAYYSAYNAQPDAIRAWSDNFGVYGPIGLAYTPGFLSWGRVGSLSLFASLFDLGAIIDYKLKQDSTVKTSTNPSTNSTATKQYSVNLGQIFSPGIHAVYGFCCNIPLSLGLGAQYGPGLTSINAAGTTNVINPSWRINAFLAVDLPFFNIINVTKTKK